MNSIFIILLLTKEIATQTLTLCKFPKISSACDLVCKTPDFKEEVSFKKQQQAYGECTVVVDQTVCSHFNNRFLIGQNKSTKETRLTIKSLDKFEDEGTWHCEYGNNQSDEKQLKTYDTIIKSSQFPNASITETVDFIIVQLQTDCMMPEPTAWLNCMDGKQMCIVLDVGNQACGKPTLRLYNVTCKTEAGCFHGNRSDVEIKVLDDITVQKKVIQYQPKKIGDMEETPPVSGDHDPTVIVITVVVVVVLSIIIVIIVIRRQRQRKSMGTK